MPAIGQTVRAEVIRVEGYGIYLRSGETTVLVLAPDCVLPHQRWNRDDFHVGQIFDVRLLHLNEEVNIYRGSIKDVLISWNLA